MKVVFLEDVEGVAQGGEVKDVKNGFARNYLLPKNLAAPATHNNLQRIEKLRRQANVDRVEKLEDMKSVAEGINDTEIVMEMRAGANDRLYGSVTGTMIADSVTDKTGISVERRWVQLDNPIRETGEFDVSIRLHSDVSANVRVIVHATGQDPLEEETADNNQESDQDDSGDEISIASSNSVEEDSVAQEADSVIDSGEGDSSEISESQETQEESAEVDPEEN
ncbi:MAG: 50S ribosomal protein L9 [Chloroflexota bacterium]|nr:50S ribosomal protein L9 [Chloroflexota bacterium]|tara:strand:- start:183 stop:851 length:669 start_codon:yes stop_codon:yes gene_type:complete